MLDYLIVGAGLFGATCARDLTDAGKRVLVIDRRDRVGGNAADERRDGILVGRYGGHIFHTSDQDIWEYMQRFADWRPYEHRVKAMARGKVYSFPINLMTFQQLYGENYKHSARFVQANLARLNGQGGSLEEWARMRLGAGLYELFIDGYTRKQWGVSPSDLPASIVKRLPVRFDWNDAYFGDTYQAMPTSGYTALVEEMLRGIPMELGTWFDWDVHVARCVIFTGSLDWLCEYRYGRLGYRSLRFEQERLEQADYQGCATMNYCDADIPYTRIVEWKHLYRTPSDVTWVMREYPAAYDGTNEPYYPQADAENKARYAQYKALAQSMGIRVGGRLGSYQYLDMHQAIAAARKLVREELA